MKRKTIIFIYLLLAIFVVGCIQPKNNADAVQISEISLADSNKGLEIKVTIDFNSFSIDKENILSYGVLIKNERISKATDLIFGTHDNFTEVEEIENNQISLIIANIDQILYNTNLSIRPYLIYTDAADDTKILYASTYSVTNLYELAKVNTSDFAKEILNVIEVEIISIINLTVNKVALTVSKDSDGYDATIVKEGNDITITLTTKPGFTFNEEVSLKVNNTTIANTNYTLTNNSIIYTFDGRDPNDYVEVAVSLDPAGGAWNSDFFKDLASENVLIATAKNDSIGLAYTVIDKSGTSFRSFYKLFLKYDNKVNAYRIVALDAATANISNLILPDYDYVLAVNDYCTNGAARTAIKNYSLSNETIGKYVLFGSNVNDYTEGNIQTIFYDPSSFASVKLEMHLEEDILPVPTRHEYRFLGWTDGTDVFSVFPQYKVSQNISSITYTAVWEPLTINDFKTSFSKTLVNLEKSVFLPSSFSDYTISWSTNNQDVISSEGVFRRPYQETSVTLTAAFHKDNNTENVTFNVPISGYKSLTAPVASSYIWQRYSSVTNAFFETLDIINCAFISANASGALSGAAFLNNVATYISPKANSKGAWVIMSVAPESQWSTIAANPMLVNQFADNIVNMINAYNFDGVDIDWETPKQGEELLFTAMMAVIYAKVKANNPNHLVTAAIAGGMWQPPRYDLNNSQQYLDLINMMTYSMSAEGGYYQNALYKRTGFHHTTFKVGNTATSCSIEESVKFYKDNYNIPNHKIVVGVAFYGMKQTRTYNSSTATWSSWAKGSSVSFQDIHNNYIHSSQYEVFYDDISQVPYIVKKDGTEFISYDNATSVLAKSNYVKANGLGGIMYWENGWDTTGVLLGAIKTGLNK